MMASKTSQEGAHHEPNEAAARPSLQPTSSTLECTPSTKGCTVKQTSLSPSDVECGLCLQILCNPVTTTCGHSFCKDCLFAAMAAAPKCPICRCPMPAYSTPDNMAVNKLLHQMIVACFPAEMAAREAEESAERIRMRETPSTNDTEVTIEGNTTTTSSPMAGVQAANTSILPMFVMPNCPILPRQKLRLHVFEERYVRLVQDCLMGGRRFGMVGPTHLGGHNHHYNHHRHRDHWSQLARVGTEVEITEIVRRPLGRVHYDISVIGVRIFCVQGEYSHHDHGYVTAHVKWNVFPAPTAASPPTPAIPDEIPTATVSVPQTHTDSHGTDGSIINNNTDADVDTVVHSEGSSVDINNATTSGSNNTESDTVTNSVNHVASVDSTILERWLEEWKTLVRAG